MSNGDSVDSRKPLRVWPGVVLVVAQWVLRFGVPAVLPERVAFGIISSLVTGALVVVWWVFFSRAAWIERLGAIVLMAGAMFGTSRLLDESIATGAMGMLFPILVVPVLCLAFVLWAVASRRLSDELRRATMVAAIVAACGVWTLVRTGGFTSEFQNDLKWRWTKTAEERLLAQPEEKPAVPPAAPVAAPVEAPKTVALKVSKELPPSKAVPTISKIEAEWSGFRGPGRNGVIPGVRIATDWSQTPPVKLWERSVGPGWSSFAIQGDRLFTQEQRGPDEVVACYKLSTGEPVWSHKDKARFWESNAGAGPRSTPTLGNGHVYTLGATGIVNALNEVDGSVVWSRDGAADAKKKIPDWGFAGSPLLYGDVVMVAVSGQVVAYDAATGSPRWLGPPGGVSYSSPQLANINGVPQILMLSGSGVASVAPADGKVLWQHEWKGHPIVQPAVTAEGDVLVSVSDSSGIRRLAVAQGPGGWRVEERWTSVGLKPYFSDFVVHKGYAFGFDGSILACIDLKDGQRKWKGGRYGHGQLALLADQDLLVVLSEEGELALVKAVPEEFTEVARLAAIEGKTWNHPVVVRDVLLARNAEHMAAFRLPAAR